MNRDEYFAYLSEIKELEMLLQEIPSEKILERISLEARLESAKEAIKGLKESGLPITIKLTFRGKPVFDSHGIGADFGSKAAGAFSEAITALAVGTSIYLQDKGPIPDKQKNQLLITGTAIGSFGFEFELPKETSNDHVTEQQRPLENAITIFQELLKQAATGSDDDIAELIDDIPQRAIKRTAEFLHLVAQNEAWFAVDFKEKQFRFQNLAQLKASSKRLQETNIQEKSEIFEGEFQGILPYSRTFEFRLVDQQTIIKGKIGSNIEDPDSLNRHLLHQHVKVNFNIKQVGKGKPRYSVLSLDQITPLPNFQK
jgi:hypothetical protein